MKKYEELFTGSGFPTSEGEEFLRKYQEVLSEIFGSEEIKNMRLSQIRTVGAHMSKMLGDTILESIVSNKK